MWLSIINKYGTKDILNMNKIQSIHIYYHESEENFYINDVVITFDDDTTRSYDKEEWKSKEIIKDINLILDIKD